MLDGIKDFSCAVGCISRLHWPAVSTPTSEALVFSSEPWAVDDADLAARSWVPT